MRAKSATGRLILPMASTSALSRFSGPRPYRRRSRGLADRFRIAAALAISVLLHLGLVRLLGDVRFHFGSSEQYSVTQPFHIDEVTFDSRVLDEPQDLDRVSVTEVAEGGAGEEAAPQDLFVENLEVDKELAAEKPDLRFAPVVEDPVTGSGGDNVVGLDSALDLIAIGEAKMRDGSELAEREATLQALLARGGSAAEGQSVIEIGSEEFDRELTDRSSGTLAAVLQSRGTGNDLLPEGYSDLDELVASPGVPLDLGRPILMKTDLLFDYDQSVLKPTARLSLMKLALIIQRNPEKWFILEGHTDTYGPDDYNLNLSRLRAEAVRNWLVDSLQLSPERLEIRACGETRPLVAPEGSVAAQALNRRVEISTRNPGEAAPDRPPAAVPPTAAAPAARVIEEPADAPPRAIPVVEDPIIPEPGSIPLSDAPGPGGEPAPLAVPVPAEISVDDLE